MPDDLEIVPTQSLGNRSTLKMNGYLQFPYAKEVLPKGNMTMLSIFKTSAQTDQMLASGPYFDIGISGNDHEQHPNSLYIATETNKLYSSKSISDNWMIATTKIQNQHLWLNQNGLWAGGPSTEKEISKLGTDAILGGKMIWEWNFNEMQWTSTTPGFFDGHIAELLVFDRELSFLENWRIHAYLYSKWFGYVVSDLSDSNKDMTIAAISGSLAEQVRKHKYDADLALIDYLDALYENTNVHSALQTFESFLPDDWQWSTLPPDEDEAVFALDSITYQYDESFVKKYQKDHSYVLIGGMGNDKLFGGYENDILIGGQGEDQLIGGGGKDIFVATDGDIIVDYNMKDNDILCIDHLLSKENIKALKNYIHFEIISDPEFSTAHTQLYIDSNGDGSGFTLDVLSGESSDNVHIESSLNGDKITLKDILYILNDIGRK